jgi:hypothetical protein
MTGKIEAIEAERPGAQEVRLRVESPAGDDSTRRALNLIALNGPVVVGESVLVNTIAVELGLGSGGLDFVLARLNTSQEVSPAGHILKMRYTPLQMPVLSVEAPESAHHDALRLFASLDDIPVVCTELHSQVPAVCASAKWALRECGFSESRIAYVMTDGSALPLALSRLVPQMRGKGLIDATITAGQAFGGDYEAINIYSALAAAKEVAQADIIVVGQGPGNAGTDTPLGFSGIDQGIAVNAAASLGGMPIVVARISFADRRDRHYGLSHHTLTILRHVARAHTLLPLPRLPDPQRRILWSSYERAELEEDHQPILVDADMALEALLATGIEVTTMGRSIDEDRPFFLSAAAAGLIAAQLVEARALAGTPMLEE